jgi:hypothetical protein
MKSYTMLHTLLKLVIKTNKIPFTKGMKMRITIRRSSAFSQEEEMIWIGKYSMNAGEQNKI